MKNAPTLKADTAIRCLLPNPLKRALIVTALLTSVGSSTFAADVVRANTAGALNLTGDWVGGVAPTAADFARWDSTVSTAANTTAALGADTTWGGIKIISPSANVVISAGNTLTLNGISGVGIDMSAATRDLTISAPVVLGGNQQWNVVSGRTVTLNSAVTGFNQGSNNLTLNGTGNVTLSWNNTTANNATATGTVTINGGILTLNATTTSPTFSGVTNMLSSSTPLVVGGGTLSSNVGSSVGTLSQTFNGLTINAGGSAFTQARGSSSGVIVNFGAITRNVGGTITLQAASSAATSGYRTSTGANGIVGGYATVNGTDFARWSNATTSIVSNSVPTYVSDTWGATNNTTVTLDSTQTAATTYSLAFRAASARTLTLSGTNTITTGGLLNSSGVGAFNNVITGGTLQGAAGADLIVHQWNTGGSLAINSVIADNTSATALTKAGTGLLILGGNNTFTGGVYLNAGTLQLGNAGALNSSTPNAVTFSNNSSAKLQLAGTSLTVSGLNTSTVIAATAPIVENANAADAVLTVNTSGANTYAGNIQNGTGAGTLGLTKTGASTLTLNGTNSYTGATTINNGTLVVKNSIASSTSINVTSPGVLDVTNSGLTVASGNTLKGTGSVLGTVTAGSGANLTPGTVGTVGTLTISSLSLTASANVNLDLLSGGTSDLFNVTGALTLGSSQVINVNLTGTGTATSGNTYTIFNFGSIANFTPSSFTVASGGTGGLTYTFASTGSSITLAITGTLATNSAWALTGSGAWAGSASNWSPATIPNATGDTANFGSAITGDSTVTLDGDKTVAVANFDSPHVYTIATGTSGSLILDNGAGVANLNDTSTPGNPAAAGQVISANVILNSNTAASVSSGETLAINGAISGAGSLTKNGAGELDLGSANSYAGATTLNAGTLQFVSGGVSTSAFNFGGGTLKYAVGNTSDLSSGRTVTFVSDATINTNGNDVVFGSAVGNSGAGGLIKTGAGKLSLAAGNTFTGASTISAGTLNIAADSSLGAVPGSATTNLTIAGGAALQFGAAMTLNANRGIAFSSGTGVIDTNGNNATIAGALSGGGLVNKIGSGTLTLTGGTNSTTATGGITIDAGTVTVASQANLPSGTLTLNGTGAIIATGAASFSPVVNGTNSITESTSGNIMGLGNVSGNGTITFGGPFVNDYTGSQTAFTGTIISTGGGIRFNGSGGGNNVTYDLSNGQGISVRNTAAAINLGALQSNNGASTLGGSGGGATQNVTYTIGAKTVDGLGVSPVDSTFAGAINNGAGTVSITKVGASTLTLTNTGTASNYTGTTLVSAGTLVVGGTTALGASSAVTVNGATAVLKGSVANVTVPGNLTLTSGAIDIRDSGIGQFSLASGQSFSMAAGTLFAQIASLGSFDSIVNVASSGSFTISGGTLDLTGSTLAAGDVALFSGFSSGSGSFTSILGYDTDAFLVTFDATVAGTGMLHITAVPEPHEYAVAIGGLLFALIVIRRRKARMA